MTLATPRLVVVWPFQVRSGAEKYLHPVVLTPFVPDLETASGVSRAALAGS
jgi:hypothetical protein